MGLLVAGNNPAALKTANRAFFTATAGQTTFTVPNGYQVGDIDVYLNGIRLLEVDDYLAVNGSTVVLTSGVNAGDSVAVVSYNQFLVSNSYSKTEADSRYLQLTGGSMSSYIRAPNYGISSYSDSAFATLEANPGLGEQGVGIKAFGRSMATTGGDILYTADSRGAGGRHRFGYWNGSSFTNTMTIDSSGRMAVPQQPHILCKTYASAVGFYSLSTISNRNLSVGTANGYSAIYAPVSGVYLISFNGIVSSSTGRYDINIFKNNGTFFSSLNEDNATGYHYRTISQAAYLTANDYIQIKFSAGAAYYTTSGGTDMEWGNFSMTFLG